MKTVVIGNLEWQSHIDSKKRTWYEAVEHAKSLGEGWRLPTIKELISIVDYYKHSPATLSELADDCPDLFDECWSCTCYLFGFDNSCAWAVDFHYGTVDFHHKRANEFFVRLVRDANKK